MKIPKILALLGVTGIVFLAQACSRSEAPAPAASAPPAASQDAPAQMAAEQSAAEVVRAPSPSDARVFFISPEDGATVSNPVKVDFGVEGMQIVKAGVDEPNSGHHHLLIDTPLPTNMDLPIPADAQHIHFGDASTSTELTLAPGQHTLQLLLGDYRHIPHNPPVASNVITITVE